jgi:hypothetical protein
MRWDTAMRRDVSREAMIEERRALVAVNVAAGLTVREVVQALGVPRSTVARDRLHVIRAWREGQTRAIDDFISLELRRYDLAQIAIWNRVQRGDLQAIDRFLKISKSRRELLGLDRRPATRLEVSGPHGEPLPPSFETLVQKVYGRSGAFGPEPNGGCDDTTLPLDVRRP